MAYSNRCPNLCAVHHEGYGTVWDHTNEYHMQCDVWQYIHTHISCIFLVQRTSVMQCHAKKISKHHILHVLPSGKLTVSYWKWPWKVRGFAHWKWRFSIAFPSDRSPRHPRRHRITALQARWRRACYVPDDTDATFLLWEKHRVPGCHGGTPIAAWCINGKHHENGWFWGYTHILGNPHMAAASFWVQLRVALLERLRTCCGIVVAGFTDN